MKLLKALASLFRPEPPKPSPEPIGLQLIFTAHPPPDTGPVEVPSLVLIAPQVELHFPKTADCLPYVFDGSLHIVVDRSIQIYDRKGAQLQIADTPLERPRPVHAIDQDRLLMSGCDSRYVWTVSSNTWEPAPELSEVTAIAWHGEQPLAFTAEDTSSHHTENCHWQETVWLLEPETWQLRALPDQSLGGRLTKGRSRGLASSLNSPRLSSASELAYRVASPSLGLYAPSDPSEPDDLKVDFGPRPGPLAQVGIPLNRWKAYPSHELTPTQRKLGVCRAGVLTALIPQADRQSVLLWEDQQLQEEACQYCGASLPMGKDKCECGTAAPNPELTRAVKMEANWLTLNPDFEQRCEGVERVRIVHRPKQIQVFDWRDDTMASPILRAELAPTQLAVSIQARKLFVGSGHNPIREFDLNNPAQPPRSYQIAHTVGPRTGDHQIKLEIQKMVVSHPYLLVADHTSFHVLRIVDDGLEHAEEDWRIPMFWLDENGRLYLQKTKRGELGTWFRFKDGQWLETKPPDSRERL